MNFTNTSSLTSEQSNHFEGMIVIGIFLGLCICARIYKCCLINAEREEQKKFEWGVQRAKLRIQLRQDLSNAI